MRFGSVCSGIEAASIAWNPLGWEAEFFSEIEPFPCAVLKHHHPTVPNYGDLNAFKDWPDANLDLLVGGTPCQSFSVAGLRGGMADPRGNLALVYLAVANRYRPRWIVWENVPGVLSSNGGRDFGAFLGGLAELGYGWAYRILDAQHFGVPQRRRRVFVVGYLGDWRRAAAVLFEPASLRGDSPPSREARERVAATLTRGAESSGKGGYAGRRRGDDENLVAPTISARTRGGGELGTDFDCDGGLIGPNVSPALKARDYKGPSSDGDGDGAPLIVAHCLRAEGFDASEDGTGRGTPLVATAFNLRGRDGGAMPEEADLASLRAASGGSSRSYIAFDTTQVSSKANRSQPKLGDPCHPLAAGGHAPTVAFHNRQDPDISGSVTRPLGARDNGMGIAVRSSVRRLTPRECERLQGFPDLYTLTPYRGKPAADGPRYKALGNSMAVPVVRWIGERIAAAEAWAQDRRSAA